MIALLLLAIVPLTDAIEDRFELVEVNHFYNENCDLVFDQLLFLDWNPTESRYDVQAWRLVKTPSILPVRNWDYSGYSCVWMDGEISRRVLVRNRVESWTQFDPELVNRDLFPKEKRRDLTMPQRKVQKSK